MTVNDRIQKLRDLMKKNKMDAYIIPSFDAHHSEYVGEHFKCRQWITGFTGSAGTAVVTMSDAGLWTDGRYYIQAGKQLEGSGVRLFRAVDPGVPTYTEWLRDNMTEGSCVGFDGTVFSVDMVKEMQKAFEVKGLNLNMEQDLIGELWTEGRPEMPLNPVFIHDIKYAGKSRTEKLNEVRNNMKQKGANYYLLTSLDDIAWLLNIRGDEVPNNPVVTAFTVISMDRCHLFVDFRKVPADVRKELESDSITLHEYETVKEFLKGLSDSDKVLLDPAMTNARLYNAIPKKAAKIESPNYTTDLKAVKNETEIENYRKCQVDDGVAMVKFIKWLEESVGKVEVTEISASDKLEALRRENKSCVGLSFDTIAGYKEHAAMMHYKATPESDYALKKEGFFLVDSGGQYYGGTTDITRTFVLGKLTDEEKKDFTLVLKSHIALAKLKFLYGATGSNLDIIARQPMWEQGLDYKCGTGHGVGYFLNVHEGPQRLSQVPNKYKFEEGMDITNEPGIYKEGKYGIRTENIMLVHKAEKTDCGQFMIFEPVTYCPIDIEGIVPDMLDDSEKKWLNDYHSMVFEKLSPRLNAEEKAWLSNATRKI